MEGAERVPRTGPRIHHPETAGGEYGNARFGAPRVRRRRRSATKKCSQGVWFEEFVPLLGQLMFDDLANEDILHDGYSRGDEQGCSHEQRYADNPKETPPHLYSRTWIGAAIERESSPNPHNELNVIGAPYGKLPDFANPREHAPPRQPTEFTRLLTRRSQRPRRRACVRRCDLWRSN